MVFTAALTPISQPWSATLGGTDGTLTSSLDKNRPGGGDVREDSLHMCGTGSSLLMHGRGSYLHSWERELSSHVGEGALFSCGGGSSLHMCGR